MSDRTMIAVGQKTVSVPKLVKRSLEVVVATALTAAVSLFIVMANGLLTAKGGYATGLSAWTAFIQRSDIIGTILLTAIVTVAFLIWNRNNTPSKR